MEEVRPFLEARRAPSAAASAGALVGLRANVYGELVQWPLGKAAVSLADETGGTSGYYLVSNPTPGTGVAGIAATGAFADAESFLLVRNTATVAEGTRIYLDYLKVQVTVAGTNGTDHRYVSKLDTGTTRYTSGGSLLTAVSPNMQNSATPKAVVYAGALVTTAASASARVLESGLLRPVIAVVGDVYAFDFGGGHPVPAGIPNEGTTVAHVLVRHCPVILGPTDQFVFSLHATSQTVGTSYEFQLGWWER